MRAQFALEASRRDGAAADDDAAAAAANSGWKRVSDCPEVEALVRASGKMLLLHKLLPKLRAEGRQCLVFSQFKVRCVWGGSVWSVWGEGNVRCVLSSV